MRVYCPHRASLPTSTSPAFFANDVSIHSAGSTTHADASSDDDDTDTLLAPASIPAPIDDAPADVLLNLIAPNENILVAADTAAHDILVPDAVPQILLMLFLLTMLLMPLMMFLLTMLLMPFPT